MLDAWKSSFEEVGLLLFLFHIANLRSPRSVSNIYKKPFKAAVTFATSSKKLSWPIGLSSS